MAKAFEALTALGKLRRFHALAQRVMAGYDLAVADITLIHDYPNHIYQIESGDGAKYVLKINNPFFRNIVEMQSEVVFLQALQRETDFIVPTPIPNRDGTYVILSDGEGIDQPRYCQLFRWVEGRNLREFEPLPIELAQQVGVTMAQLHQYAETFTPPVNFSRNRGNRVWVNRFRNATIPARIYDEEDDIHFPLAQKQVLRDTAARIQWLLDCLYQDESQLRFLHYDLHADNLKWHKGDIHIIDFEDVIWGYPMQDMAITLYEMNDLPNATDVQQAILAGYNQIHPITGEEYAQLTLFLHCENLGFFTDFFDRFDYPQALPEFPQFLLNSVTWHQEWLENPKAAPFPLPQPQS